MTTIIGLKQGQRRFSFLIISKLSNSENKFRDV